MELSAPMIGIIVFLFMLLLVFLGCPVFVSLLSASFVGFIWLKGGSLTLLLSKFTVTPFDLAANYTYAVLPMFMLVGSLAAETGIAGSAFDAMHTWLGRIRGGLLYTVIAANAVFGACSGSSVAGNIVFGRLALPELDAHGYKRKWSLGCITASGALSCLIPPSMSIIMYCMIVPDTLSVGKALMCGIGPGILVALMLALTVVIISFVDKGSIPAGGGPKYSIGQKLKALLNLIPIVCLFAIIIGGCFLGFFTATVGGAIGAMAVTIYALVKRIPLKRIAWNMWDAACMEAGIFPIIISGQLFGSFIAGTKLADMLSDVIASVNAPRLVIFSLVFLMYIFLGCVMDVVSAIIITVPVVYPILTGLGYDGYVLLIVMVFVCEIAGLTPPIGMNVFATANALRINSSEIFSGVIPYFICDVICVYLIVLFPQIALAIPTMLGAL